MRLSLVAVSFEDLLNLKLTTQKILSLLWAGVSHKTKLEIVLHHHSHSIEGTVMVEDSAGRDPLGYFESKCPDGIKVTEWEELLVIELLNILCLNDHFYLDRDEESRCPSKPRKLPNGKGSTLKLVGDRSGNHFLS